MVVDVHAHILTPTIVEAAKAGRDLHGVRFGSTDDGRLFSEFDGRRSVVPRLDLAETLETRLANMDAAEVDAHVLSLSPSLYYYGGREPARWPTPSIAVSWHHWPIDAGGAVALACHIIDHP